MQDLTTGSLIRHLLSVAAVLVQLALNLLLLRREFRIRLAFEPALAGPLAQS